MPNIWLQKPTYDRLQARRAPGQTNSAALAALLDVTGAPTPTPLPAPPAPLPPTLPIRCAIVIPADQPRYAADSALLNVAASWIDRFKIWMQREAGLTFDHELRLIRTRLTRAQLGTGEGKSWLDDCGQGGWETIAWDVVARQELKWPGTGPRRETMFILNWGGWAGGRYDVVADAGGAIIGDWQLRNQLTGEPDPCCVVRYSATSGACVSPGGAWSHEMLHCLGVHCHAGDTLADGSKLAFSTFPLDFDWPPQTDKRGTVLVPGQVLELGALNTRFLRAP